MSKQLPNPIRVEILNHPDDQPAGTVQFRVIDPLADVPTWLHITPGNIERPFLADPLDHYFNHTQGTMGRPKALVSTARAYLQGEIDKSEAEEQFRSALAEWHEIHRK